MGEILFFDLSRRYKNGKTPLITRQKEAEIPFVDEEIKGFLQNLIDRKERLDEKFDPEGA